MCWALKAGATPLRTAFQCLSVCPVSRFVPMRNCKPCETPQLRCLCTVTFFKDQCICRMLARKQSLLSGYPSCSRIHALLLTGSRKEYRKRILSTYGLFKRSIAIAGSVITTTCIRMCSFVRSMHVFA